MGKCMIRVDMNQCNCVMLLTFQLCAFLTHQSCAYLLPKLTFGHMMMILLNPIRHLFQRKFGHPNPTNDRFAYLPQMMAALHYFY